jgi:two-component system LytT family response regulator
MLDAAIRALIVDDERLARQKIRGLLRSLDDIEVVGECANGVDALTATGGTHPDLLFLDVQMPDLDGIGVLSALPPDDLPEVIFVTAHNSYMEKAFEVHAIDYLRKPYSNERFYAAVAHARRRIQEHRAALAPKPSLRRSTEQPARSASVLSDLQGRDADPRIALQDGRTGAWHIVNRDHIEWIGAVASGGVCAHVGKESYVLRRTLTELEGVLERGKFLRVHRSYIVNTAHIRQIKPLLKGEFAVLLSSGTVLDSGRTYRTAVEEFLSTRLGALHPGDTP